MSWSTETVICYFLLRRIVSRHVIDNILGPDYRHGNTLETWSGVPFRPIGIEYYEPYGPLQAGVPLRPRYNSFVA